MRSLVRTDPGPAPPWDHRAQGPGCPGSSPRGSAGFIPAGRGAPARYARPRAPGRCRTPPRDPPAWMRPCAMATAMRPAPTKPTRRRSGPASAAAISPPPAPAPLSCSSIGYKDLRLRPFPSGSASALHRSLSSGFHPLAVHWAELCVGILWAGPRRARHGAGPSWRPPESFRWAELGGRRTCAPVLRVMASHGRILGACADQIHFPNGAAPFKGEVSERVESPLPQESAWWSPLW